MYVCVSVCVLDWGGRGGGGGAEDVRDVDNAVENHFPLFFHGHVTAIGSAACSYFVEFLYMLIKFQTFKREMWLYYHTCICIGTAYFPGLAAPSYSEGFFFVLNINQ